MSNRIIVAWGCVALGTLQSFGQVAPTADNHFQIAVNDGATGRVFRFEGLRRLPAPREAVFQEFQFHGHGESSDGRIIAKHITVGLDLDPSVGPQSQRIGSTIWVFSGSSAVRVLGVSEPDQRGQRTAVLVGSDAGSYCVATIGADWSDLLEDGSAPRLLATLFGVFMGRDVSGGQRISCNPEYAECFNGAQDNCHGAGLIEQSFEYKCIKSTGEVVCSWVCGPAS